MLSILTTNPNKLFRKKIVFGFARFVSALI